MHRRKFMCAGIGMLAFASGFTRAGLPEPGVIERRAAPDTRQFHTRGADLAFGTTVTIQVVQDNKSEARLAIRDAFEQARAVDRLLSIYREGSQVHTLNRTGSIDRPHAHLLAVVAEARRLSLMTDGAFDITVQPLWLAASTGRDITAARARVGWRNLHVGRDALWFARSGMAITLNGIAQGYATDLALNALRARGIRHALVDIGELAATGRRAQDAQWQAAIADPRDTSRALHAVPLDGRCLATSGDYASVYSEDYSCHHIVDPATGHSPAELSSVSVLAPTAMLADGLSTALMVMGKEKGMQLVRRMRGVDALFVNKAGGQSRSAGFPLA